MQAFELTQLVSQRKESDNPFSNSQSAGPEYGVYYVVSGKAQVIVADEYLLDRVCGKECAAWISFD